MSSLLKKAQLWLFAYGWAWLLFVLFSLRRERMSHDNGLTLRGRLRITPAPGVPAHDFFEPGREFPCRLRHASVTYPDDTVIQIRSASLKFADSACDSPLDIEMNTGTTSLFWSARNFSEFAHNKRYRINALPYSPYYDKYPNGLRAAEEGVRKYPSSFTQLSYYSQTVSRFVGRDGVPRYARYRLLPRERVSESGQMTSDELRNRWREEVAPGETRAPNYLRQEYLERIARAPIVYTLQIQLHTPQAGESPEILNSNVAWDEATHPYMDLATVEVDSLVTFEAGEQMRFSLNHAPPSLGLLPAASIDDYNSVNYMRAKSDLARNFRAYFNKAWGPREPSAHTARPS